jgi:hypothetical protein
MKFVRFFLIFLFWATSVYAVVSDQTSELLNAPAVQTGQVQQPKSTNGSSAVPQSEIGKNKILVKTKDWGVEYGDIKNLFGQATQDRRELDELRQSGVDRYFKMREGKNPDFVGLASALTEETIAYIKKRISETVKKIGPAPTDFAIFTMGSMARQESGLYTDLEIGVLVKEKNIQVIKYFQKFSQVLSDRFFLLGEHPDVGGKGLRMDEADNSPAHLKFFARYACEEQTKNLLKSALEKREFDKIPFEGSRIFIATPKEFAQHSSPAYLDQDASAMKLADSLLQEEIQRAIDDPLNRNRDKEEISKEVKYYFNILNKPLTPRERQISASAEALTRNIRFLYGDEKLFSDYMSIRESILMGNTKYQNPFYQTRRQEIAYLEMKKDLTKYLSKPDAAIVTGKLGKEIDIKRELYRFPEQILTNLGFWYDLGEQNTVKIAQLLAQKGIMSKELSTELIEYLNFIIGLRFKKQSVCKKQTHAIPTTPQEYQEQVQELQDDLKTLEAQRDFLLKSNSPSADIEKIDKDILKKRQELVDIKKLKPLKAGSILTSEEITLLNDKYLPLLNKLFEAAKLFVQGNKKAFLEIKLEKPAPVVNQPAAVKEPAVKPASEPKQKIITEAELEQMIINNQSDLIVNALIAGEVQLGAVAQLASKRGKIQELRKIHKDYILKRAKASGKRK